MLVRGFRNVLFITTVFALIAVAPMFEQPVVLPPCAPGSLPGIVSNLRMDGELVRDGREYVIRDVRGNERMLARRRSGNATGPYYLLKESRQGVVVHAEFCGPFLTLVSLDGVPVHTRVPPTQVKLDKRAASMRYLGRAAVVYLLVLVLGLICYLARKRHQARVRS